MNTKLYIAPVIALFLGAFPFTSIHAATFLPVSEEVASLRSESKGDVYAASNSVVITAPVQGDIFAAGDGVDISGPSDGSIFAVGRNLAITGESKDDVRVAGSIISVGSTVAHDLFAAGSTVLITKDSNIHGDAYLAGETVTISGTIHGNIKVGANKVIITKGAVVMGDITSHGSTPIVEDGATVSGKITTIAPQEKVIKPTPGFTIRAFIMSVVSASILALALLFAAPVLVTKNRAIITKTPVQSGLLGLLWMILCIPAALLLMISGIGMYIGIFVLVITLPVSVLAFGLLQIEAGTLLYRLVAKKQGTPWQNVIIGALALSLIALLGPIGFILIFIAFLIAFGSALTALWSMTQGK